MCLSAEPMITKTIQKQNKVEENVPPCSFRISVFERLVLVADGTGTRSGSRTDGETNHLGFVSEEIAGASLGCTGGH